MTIDWDLMANNLNYQDPDEMVIKLYYKHRSANKVANLLYVSVGSIINKLKQLGIERTYKGNKRKTEKQIRFLRIVTELNTKEMHRVDISKATKSTLSYTWWMCNRFQIPYKSKKDTPTF